MAPNRSVKHFLPSNDYHTVNGIEIDYQWDTTDPVSGEKLDGEWFNAEFSNRVWLRLGLRT